MTEIYIVDTSFLCDAEVFRARYSSASDARRAKIDALRSEQEKRLSLGVWLLLEYALRNRGIASPRLAYGEAGKPYLAEHPDVFMSLSHSGDRVMCALSSGEVGCDVQEIGSMDPAMAKRYFHPKEIELLRAATDAERQALFYRIWTAKESYVKALGSGISRGMRDFYVDFGGGMPCVRGEKMYYIKEVKLCGYAACACSGDIEMHLHIVELP